MLTPEQQKIALLEQQINRLTTQVAELNRQVAFFVRENNRRKSESAQLANAIRRG
jgi:regulator of replication initiation timing